MKTLITALLILASPACAGTSLQTQDIGYSTIAYSGANTHSGAEVFSSTVSVGPSVLTTAVSYASVIKNVYTVVAAVKSSGGTSWTFTGIDPSYPHRLTVSYKHSGSTGQPYIYFNNDRTSGRYRWMSSQAANSGSGFDNAGSNSDTAIYVAIAVTDPTDVVAMYTVNFDSAGFNASLTGTAMRDSAASWLDTIAEAGHYHGVSKITRMDIDRSAGALYGTITLEALVPAGF